MTDYILAIDQGTTSSRAIVFDSQSRLVGDSQQEFEQYFPCDGWVEHKPADIWQTTIQTCEQALRVAKLKASDIRCIGISNQRETTVVWDRVTGEPIYNAIVWQDRRTAQYCGQLKNDGYEALVQAKTGLLIDPYFSATKLRWILDNVPGARSRAERGELAFGTVDCFLLWRLTGGASHYTDATNASRTLLFNIHDQCWDKELLALFDIPAALLPAVMDCSAEFGVTKAELLGSEIAITGMAGDQQAALFGQACFKPGMAKCTYGTGSFLMLNCGARPVQSANKLLTTVAYRLNGNVTYAIEGSNFIAGAAIQWLRDGLKILDNASQSEALAEQADINHGVYLVPAFTGLGAPYWDPDARATLTGLSRDSGIAQIVSAALQAVCYQTRDLVVAMAEDGAEASITLRVDGGMAENDWLLQFLTDILQTQVDRPVVTETTALGAAYLAGLQAGIYLSLESIETLWKKDKTFYSGMSFQQSKQLYSGWLSAVSRTLSGGGDATN